MSAVIQLNEARQRRASPAIDDTLPLSGADLAAAGFRLAETFYSWDQNGCVSVWFEERESLVRQCWGASKSRLAFFSEAVVNLGLVIKRSGQDWLRFCMNGVPNDLEQCEIAEKRLAAFHQLFLDQRRLQNETAASPIAQSLEEISGDRRVAEKMEEVVSAPMPEFLKTAPLNAFPILFSDEQIEARARPKVKVRVQAADYLEVLKESYPEIAETIASTWGKRECENFMVELIFGKRRAGQYFSEDASSALLELFERHAREFVFRSVLEESSANERRNSPTVDIDRTDKLVIPSREIATV